MKHQAAFSGPTKVSFTVSAILLLTAAIAQAQQQLIPRAEQLQPRCTENALPDITVSEVQWGIGSTENRRIGETFPVFVDVRNIGQCRSGSFKVKLSVYEQNLAEGTSRKHAVGVKKVHSLKPFRTNESEGSYATITFNYTIPFAWGDYSFAAKADFENLVEEWDEDNNFKDAWNYQVDTR